MSRVCGRHQKYMIDDLVLFHKHTFFIYYFIIIPRTFHFIIWFNFYLFSFIILCFQVTTYWSHSAIEFILTHLEACMHDQQHKDIYKYYKYMNIYLSILNIELLLWYVEFDINILNTWHILFVLHQSQNKK